ncbi:MAG: response regulator [Pseudomonadota bacterium]
MTPLKILLVDDERQFAETLAQRLHLRGIAADCAFSGKQAIHYLDNDKTVEVVIMDVNMPGGDGMETIRELKDRHPLVEVIMLTGQACIDAAIEAIKLGAFDYLSKPCELDQLIARAEQAVSRKKDREARIFDVRTKLYITKQERDDLISRILNG